MSDPLAPSASPPRLILRRRALADGFSESEILRLRRTGAWLSLRAGAYVPADAAAALDAEQRHRLLTAAAVDKLRQPVVSHTSAAVLLGIPLWRTRLGAVHVTREPPARTARSATVVNHAARLDPADLVVVDGLALTSAARTVIDLARMLPFEQAVVAADGALHRGLTTPDELAAAVRRMSGVVGMRDARRVVAFADRRSESVGESRSRVMMHVCAVPAPDLQVEVFDALGRLVGRSDFGWEGGRALGEFDGRVKYGRLLRPSQSPGDAVFFEKRREDAIRETGRVMARWTWDDLDCPAATTARINRVIEMAGRGR